MTQSELQGGTLADCVTKIRNGWAERHPLAGRYGLPANIVMVYGPRDDDDIGTVEDLVRASHSFASDGGISLYSDQRRPAEHTPARGKRGPVAFVTSDLIIYRLARTYAALGRPQLTIEVFRELDEAKAWLVQTAP